MPRTALDLYRHRNDRKVVYKATYEGLLAETIGVLQGGCMSSIDRALEMAEQRMAMKKQFTTEGKLISYNDKFEDKVTFYQNYASTKAKHDFAEMATGTAASKDSETRGFFNRGIISQEVESPAEKVLASSLAKLRKGQYDFAETSKSYQVRSQKLYDQHFPPPTIVKLNETTTPSLTDAEEITPLIIVEDERKDANPTRSVEM